MRRRTANLLVLAAVLSMAAAATTASASTGHAAKSAGHGRLIPAVKGQALPSRNADTTSLNWSGYATDPGSGITGVTSSFTVPTAGAIPPGFAATWTGIGGYTSSDLIQAGTSENSSGLVSDQYYAWYEILPASETQLTNCTGDSACTVTPGDKVTVDIHQVGTDLWSVSLVDAGHWSWQQNISYASTESSAEWIFEAPTLGVQTIPADTGTNYFGSTNTFTDASGTHSIAAGNPVTIDMGPGLINEATPSALAPNGESFNVCAYAQSCAAPAN
ncbi:MAG TPA: G1 family glutamic endopeptidase [Mycobacteriales bacterium]|nr:G1 family glutamic endopeptidase [Mycobacteriales bacterium]